VLRRLGIVVIVVAVASGCSSSDDSEETSATTPTTVVTPAGLKIARVDATAAQRIDGFGASGPGGRTTW
jgi:hypothetical protein